MKITDVTFMGHGYRIETDIQRAALAPILFL